MASAITVSTVELMRELDRRAIEDLGIPGPILMEHAGHAVYEVLRREVGLEGRRLLVVCGAGNNGGDGFVIARKAHSAGAKVRVVLLGSPERYSADTLGNAQILSGLDIPIERLFRLEERLGQHTAWAEVIVDALFGTGLTREVSGRYRQAIEAINAAPATVVAVDIPSGVDGNSGAIHGVAVEAAHTVTFGLPKQGNLLYPGAARGGRLWVSSISFPPALQDPEELETYLGVPPALPPRRADGHKGCFGDGLVVAGAGSYFGAPMFAAQALLRAGAGYARLAAPASVVQVVAGLAPELVFLPQSAQGDEACLDESCFDGLMAQAALVDVVILGPGLGAAEDTAVLTRRLVEAVEVPLILDGDGLNALASDQGLELLRGRRAAQRLTVLTPHLGEMARLLDRSVAEIKADPIAIAREAARSWGVLLVLKGAHSLIAAPDGRVFINPSGNHGMATAGSGDVLAGILGATLCSGLEAVDAVRAGVFLHGLAGDLAAEELGADGMLARDILAQVPAALRRYRQEHRELQASFYGAFSRL